MPRPGAPDVPGDPSASVPDPAPHLLPLLVPHLEHLGEHGRLPRQRGLLRRQRLLLLRQLLHLGFQGAHAVLQQVPCMLGWGMTDLQSSVL